MNNTVIEIEENNIRIIKNIFEVVSSKQDMSAIRKYIDKDMTVFLDGSPNFGIIWWCRWFRLVQLFAKHKFSNLSLKGKKFSLEDSIVKVSVMWYGEKNGKQLTSQLFPASFEINGDKVKNIWTYRTNYKFIFGEWIRYRPYYWLILFVGLVYFSFVKIPVKSEPLE